MLIDLIIKFSEYAKKNRIINCKNNLNFGFVKQFLSDNIPKKNISVEKIFTQKNFSGKKSKIANIK